MLASLPAFCQADSIYLHNGRVIGGKVIGTLPKSITYTQGASEVLRVLSPHAVQRIVFADDRDEWVGQEIPIQGESDWEQVILIVERTEAAGLTYGGELSATGGGKFVDEAQAEQDAMIRLKKEAARMRCPFLQIQSSKVKESGHVGRRVKKSAVAYRY